MGGLNILQIPCDYSLTNKFVFNNLMKEDVSMYRSNGNDEAFAHPKKPENVDRKQVYLVGSVLASLTAAAF